MKFRTEINIPKNKNNLDYNSNIVLYGSCFTENLENNFKHFKFQNLSNSHGILFHPNAIKNAISDCVIKKEYNQHDLIYFNNKWLSLNHHTKFSSDDLDEILTQINSAIIKMHHVLKNATHILITLGTSWVYRLIETDRIVANCHKLPQKKFRKEILSLEEIKNTLDQIILLIQQINSNAKILFTVSPVRHLKDGFIENTISKSNLHLAIHQIIDNKNSFYFPSYEIMMDDLRDYRFYKNDLLHPTKTAMAYIWQIFKNTWINENSFSTMKKIDQIQKSLKHRAFNQNSESHQKFLKNLDLKIEEVTKQFPNIKFKKKTV